MKRRSKRVFAVALSVGMLVALLCVGCVGGKASDSPTPFEELQTRVDALSVWRTTIEEDVDGVADDLAEFELELRDYTSWRDGIETRLSEIEASLLALDGQLAEHGELLEELSQAIDAMISEE